MATAEQIKSLIRSHYLDDKERFYTIALQMAAHEALQGHSALASEIRELVDRERAKGGRGNLKVIEFPQELKGLVLTEHSTTPKAALVAPESLTERIDRVIHEFRQRTKLKAYGLMHRRKILLVGPPGTGKSLTARILAKELALPLHTIQVDRLVTKFMGETGAKLRQVFDLISQEIGVYFFDEFDAIGGERSLDNDVGEMRRVLNSFLQFIEQDRSDSVIIAATNNPQLLDHALFRRFDDVLYYELPTESERRHLMENVLGTFIDSKFAWKKLLSESEDLSYSEIDMACRDAIKTAILTDKTKIHASSLTKSMHEKKNAYRGYRRK